MEIDDYSEKTDVFEKKIEKLKELIKHSRRMTVFTGAGVSTMSGIPDFRGKHGVYTDPWNGMEVEEIIDIDFFHKEPGIFYKWAKEVWYHLEDYEPNVVHNVVASMEAKGFIKGVYTQNIDMLHQKAGSKNVFEIHGSPAHHYCTKCGRHYTYEQIAPIVRKEQVPICSACSAVIKPDIVFYGESLNGLVLNRAWEEFSHSDLCLVLGSSLTVQPAASLPILTKQSGGKVVIVNAQETSQDQNACLKFYDLGQTFKALQDWMISI